VTITVWRDGTWKVWEHRAALHAEADPGFLVNISESDLWEEWGKMPVTGHLSVRDALQAAQSNRWLTMPDTFEAVGFDLDGTVKPLSELDYVTGFGFRIQSPPADEPTVVGE
jgi:hypothetical protein